MTQLSLEERVAALEQQLSECVDKVANGEMTVEEIDRDFAVLASLCESSDPADEERLEQAIQEAQRQAKEQVRRQMGLA